MVNREGVHVAKREGNSERTTNLCSLKKKL